MLVLHRDSFPRGKAQTYKPKITSAGGDMHEYSEVKGKPRAGSSECLAAREGPKAIPGCSLGL